LEHGKGYPYTTDSHSNPFILVVDDSTDNANVLTLLLRQKGYTAVAVASGAEAIRFLEKIIPAVVILDVMMPGMDGFEVLQWIRGNQCLARLPVMMYTADPSPEVHGRALRSGAQEFLVKGRAPISELLGAVGRHAMPSHATPEDRAN